MPVLLVPRVQQELQEPLVLLHQALKVPPDHKDPRVQWEESQDPRDHKALQAPSGHREHKAPPGRKDPLELLGP